MKYNVGDRVKVKSIQWFNENFNDDYNVVFANGWHFSEPMSIFCGNELIIEKISHATNPPHYIMKDNMFAWTDEMIEGLAEEEPNDCEKCGLTRNSIRCLFMDNCPHNKQKNIIEIPEDWVLKDENGNVINAQKIVLEKLVVPKFKKGDKIKDKNNRVWYVVHVGNRHFDISRICAPNAQGYFVPIEDQDYYELVPDIELPKTFEDCVSVLMREGGNRMSLELMNTFRKLIDARNAYWTIYGKENGLGKPWEPDWNNISDKYCIYFVSGYAWSKECQTRQCPFAFPTAEMRDAFKENFDPDIEICKEFL